METETLPVPVPGPEPEAKVSVASQEQTPSPDQPQQAVESAPAKSEPEFQADEAAKKPKQSVSERIGQIHAQKKQAEADRDFALSTARRLQGELDRLRQQPIDHLPYEQQDAARLQSVVKAERLQEKLAEVDEQSQRTERLLAQQYQAKLEAARERIPTLESAMASIRELPLAPQTAEIVIESELAAEITNWLGTNLAKAWEISALPAHKQAAEIARIESRLKAGPSPRRHSTAPPPPPSITGAYSPAGKDPQTMSMEEYSKWYAARRKA